MINKYISCILNPWWRTLNKDFTLHNCLFRFSKPTKNIDPDKHKYSRYGVIFGFRSEFSFTDESLGKNVIIFGADMSLLVHTDNKNKDI